LIEVRPRRRRLDKYFARRRRPQQLNSQQLMVLTLYLHPLKFA
jgi:hypothetical protein